MDTSRPVLVIPDLQIPYEAEKALKFCSYLKRHYRIPDENILNVGDEVDNLHGGLYPKDPDNPHSAVGELKAAKEKIIEWANIFPEMKIATSNHGMRWAKKATAAEIPSQMMRLYSQVLCMPEGWTFKDKWVFDKLKHPFAMIHGVGYSGVMAQRTMALDLGISVVHGHLVHAGISHVVTAHQTLWGMCVGALIDIEAYAFKYSKDSRFKACRGAGVIFDQGKMPVWVPYE